MEALAATETRSRATAQRRPRRPKEVSGPKRRAFAIDGGEPVDAAHALTGAGIYEYGHYAVHRKRVASAPATEDRSWYFAFDSLGRGEPDAVSDDEAMTATHAMLQAIVWEKRFVQCTIDDELFSADLTDVVRAGHGADMGALLGHRRPDIRARAVRSTERRLNGRALDVEIAVTNPARTYDRIGDLMRAGRPCIELFVPRDERLEADPGLLEAHLRAGLLAGAFTARWIVAPDGTKALVKPVDEVRNLLEKQRVLADDELAGARSDVRAARELLETCEDIALGDGSDDRAALARLETEREGLLELVDARHHDADATSLVWLIAGRIMPSLRERRLRTRALRLSCIRSEIHARCEPKRSGLMQRIDAFDRAMHAPMSKAAARRAEAESLVAIGLTCVRHAEEHVARVAEYHRKLDELERAGARELLFPARTSLRATIAYEHRRRFG